MIAARDGLKTMEEGVAWIERCPWASSSEELASFLDPDYHRAMRWMIPVVLRSSTRGINTTWPPQDLTSGAPTTASSL
jgi:hypothetical protein